MRRLGTLLALAVCLALALTSCAGLTRGSDSEKSPATGPSEKTSGRAPGRFVLAISVDGLNVEAIRRLGRSGAPNFYRLIDHGAATLNARTERERTITLPNHTGMLTGRPVDRTRRGHGVTFNTDRGVTVHDAARHRVGSVFNVVHAGGRRTALFASKEKFALFRRSWSGAIDRFTVREDNPALVDAVRRDLRQHPAGFTFLHLSAPDAAGHAHGFMTKRYLTAVRRVDRLLGKLLVTIRHRPALRRGLRIVLTADHGGAPGKHRHNEPQLLANYRIPFLVWGPGVASRNLYALNSQLRSPGRTRTTYAGEQPVRNAMLADLATDLLGLEAVPGSVFNARQWVRVS